VPRCVRIFEPIHCWPVCGVSGLSSTWLLSIDNHKSSIAGSGRDFRILFKFKLVRNNLTAMLLTWSVQMQAFVSLTISRFSISEYRTFNYYFLLLLEAGWKWWLSIVIAGAQSSSFAFRSSREAEINGNVKHYTPLGKNQTCFRELLGHASDDVNVCYSCCYFGRNVYQVKETVKLCRVTADTLWKALTTSTAGWPSWFL
jgi:hypothetical protein